ncbi:hypothetical protein [Terrabacter sp. NPDC080008]|uniref:hypothetical protein n=1 Tax=Terrabacter sp. NPDC080008 TaxID=3155176 RepID=UPI003450B33A
MAALASGHSIHQGASRLPCDRDLIDGVLLEEILLLTDVIAAVRTAESHLTPPQLDSLLGVTPESLHQATSPLGNDHLDQAIAGETGPGWSECGSAVDT